jgi:hypothetical protein
MGNRVASESRVPSSPSARRRLEARRRFRERRRTSRRDHGCLAPVSSRSGRSNWGTRSPRAPIRRAQDARRAASRRRAWTRPWPGHRQAARPPRVPCAVRGYRWPGRTTVGCFLRRRGAARARKEPAVYPVVATDAVFLDDRFATPHGGNAQGTVAPRGARIMTPGERRASHQRPAEVMTAAVFDPGRLNPRWRTGTCMLDELSS